MTYNNTVMNPPANGVIYVQSTSTIPSCNSNAQDGNVTVRGTVSGQLTVAADQNIYLSGNVAYNNDPRTDPVSTDMVGLVANQNITVIREQCPHPAGNVRCPGGASRVISGGRLVGLQGKRYHRSHGPIRQFD